MSFLSPDTSPEAARVQIEVLRKLGPEGRLKMTFDLIATARILSEAGVRQRHPEFDDEQVRLEVIRLRLGDDLFNKVYGHKNKCTNSKNPG